MAHMRPEVQHMVCYLVETDCGTECVPEDVCGTLDVDAANASEAELASVFELRLRDYCEGRRIEADIQKREGYFARLSAPGYLDCTEWIGPYDDEATAIARALRDV